MHTPYSWHKRRSTARTARGSICSRDAGIGISDAGIGISGAGIIPPMDELHDNRAGSAHAAADRDSLILVDEADQDVGHLSKARCHEGRGILHRAFSLLIFNRSGELLIQQRSACARLWALDWSNSWCSHPRFAESMEAAIHRRLY